MNSNDKDNQNELDPGIWGPDSFCEKVALLSTFFFTKNLSLYIYSASYYVCIYLMLFKKMMSGMSYTCYKFEKLLEILKV